MTAFTLPLLPVNTRKLLTMYPYHVAIYFPLIGCVNATL